MTSLSTHVLDTSLGAPAAGVGVRLSRRDGDVLLGEASTDADGRVAELGPGQLESGDYVLRFDTRAYFAACGVEGFFPEVVIVFTVARGVGHYHVPLLLSPFGFSTYRGS